MLQWGVSPAWMISRYGGEFGPAEVAAELPRIAAAGFQTVQLETFLVGRIGDWERGGAESVLRALSEQGLAAEVFVAHCLLDAFRDPASLEEPAWSATARRIARIAAGLEGVTTVSIPLPAFEGDAENAAGFRLLEEQWRRVAGPFEDAGLTTAVEILPGSFGGTPEGLERLMRSGAFADTGLNFDSGHFNAAGFDLVDLIRRYGGRVRTTHLCDNDGVENSSSPPGSGTVPWRGVVEELLGTGYAGSWDIECVCEPGRIESTYREALAYLAGLTGRVGEAIESKE